MSSESDRAKLHFFQLATQYYVAGRFAVHAQLMPVSANLLHHAIEMYLKGALTGQLTLQDMKNRLKHNLPRAWEEFKRCFNDPAFATFDRVVAELDKFETVRYPDSIISEGMTAQLALSRGDLVSSTPTGRTEPIYELVLEDVDALVKIVFEKAKFNPRAYFSALNQDSLRYLSMHNRHVSV